MDLKEKDKQNPHRHPWEISRANTIRKLIAKRSPETIYADIGAGDQFFVNELVKRTNKPIYAVDINYESVNNSAENSDMIIECKNISDIPENSVDCVLLMDVLEHVEDESVFLDKVMAILKDHGELIVTVPAHSFLFTPHDVFLGHFRRYSRNQLLGLLKNKPLEIKKVFYTYTSLFLIRCLQLILVKLNIIKKMDKGIGNWKFGENHIITRALVKMLDLDASFNKFLQNFKISLTGLSLCVICQKKPA